MPLHTSEGSRHFLREIERERRPLARKKRVIGSMRERKIERERQSESPTLLQPFPRPSAGKPFAPCSEWLPGFPFHPIGEI